MSILRFRHMALLVVLLLPVAPVTGWAWDTKVEIRHCDPDSGYASLNAYNGADGLCWATSTNGSVSLTKGITLECDETNKGGCKVRGFNGGTGCSGTMLLDADTTMLVFEFSGNTPKTYEIVSGSVNCCDHPDITNNICESYILQCRRHGISGKLCMEDYVPCMLAYDDQDKCNWLD